MSTVVSVKGLAKRYGQLTAVNDVCFGIEKGEILASCTQWCQQDNHSLMNGQPVLIRRQGTTSGISLKIGKTHHRSRLLKAGDSSGGPMATSIPLVFYNSFTLSAA